MQNHIFYLLKMIELRAHSLSTCTNNHYIFKYDDFISAIKLNYNEHSGGPT